jgi:hypothetical protein
LSKFFTRLTLQIHLGALIFDRPQSAEFMGEIMFVGQGLRASLLSGASFPRAAACANAPQKVVLVIDPLIDGAMGAQA